MKELEKINAFLSAKKIAVSGVSHNKKKFGYQVFKMLADKGYEVFPVNPTGGEIDSTSCHKEIADIPSEVKNLLIVTAKDKTPTVVEEALKSGVEKIWIQNMCETPEAINLLKEKQISHITKRCIFMYTQPEGVHKFHKTLAKLFRTYAR